MQYYLLKNNIAYSNVEVGNNHYSFLSPYLMLGFYLTSYDNTHTFSINYFGCYTQNISKNSTKVTIVNGNDAPKISDLSFKSSPLFINGAKVIYNIKTNGSLGFNFSAYYLTCNFRFPKQEIEFPKTSEKLNFESTTINQLGLTIGISFNINE